MTDLQQAHQMSRKFDRMCAIRRKMIGYSNGAWGLSEATKAHLNRKASDLRLSINLIKPAAKVAKDYIESDYRSGAVSKFLTATKGRDGFEILMSL